MIPRGILTVAIGKKYAAQAKYLALSCMLHAPHIPRAVITDQEKFLSPYYDICIPPDPDCKPFALKTRLYHYTPFEKTLYLDADSLVIHNTDSYWETLDHRSFAYTGEPINTGEWYLDIAALIKETALPWVPKFNSGMFLFDKSERAKRIFDTAFLSMGENRFNVAFFRKDMLPDEPFFAISLAEHGEQPVEDYGRFSRTLIGADKIKIDVVRGYAFFRKKGVFVFPLVVHFCGRFGMALYFFQKAKLFFCFHTFHSCLFGLFALVKKAMGK
jgi:hypothetical protein